MALVVCCGACKHLRKEQLDSSIICGLSMIGISGSSQPNISLVLIGGAPDPKKNSKEKFCPPLC